MDFRQIGCALAPTALHEYGNLIVVVGFHIAVECEGVNAALYDGCSAVACQHVVVVDPAATVSQGTIPTPACTGTEARKAETRKIFFVFMLYILGGP